MKNFIINIKKYIKEYTVIFLSTCMTMIISPYILIKQFPSFIYFIVYFDPKSTNSELINIKLGILSILLIYIILFYLINKKDTNKNKKSINIILCIIFILITMLYNIKLVFFNNIGDGLGYCHHTYKDLEILKYPKDKQDHIEWINNRPEIIIE